MKPPFFNLTLMTRFQPRPSWVCFLWVFAALQPLRAAAPNTLSPAEKAAGWRLLFDGKTTAGWRGFKKATFPNQGWTVRDGWLVKLANVRGGDVITVDTFDNFELSWDWKISPHGNNGVKYFITEERPGGAVGHEYQMMDDAGKTGKHSTGSFYDVLPARADKPMKPAGDINHSRILVRGTHVEHWLNGVKILEYELGSPEVTAGVARSKFKNVKGFGTKIKGHILLTDHQDQAWFRNLKIREF
jgi:3-keto-disaccharide hydrolase